jgi:hypothetical protein
VWDSTARSVCSATTTTCASQPHRLRSEREPHWLPT